MLKSITVENFKSFNAKENLELEFLTLLTGLNGSGKSSFYQVLSLLIQSKDSTARYVTSKKNTWNSDIPILNVNGPLITVGKREELFFDKNKNSVKFELHWNDDTMNAFEFSMEQPYSSSPEHKELFLASAIYCKGMADNNQRSYHLSRKEHKWSIKGKTIFEIDSFELNRIITTSIRSKIKSEKPERIFNDEVEFTDIFNLTFLRLDIISFSIDFDQIENCIAEKYKQYFDIAEIKAECVKQNIPTDNIRIGIDEKLTNSYYLTEKNFSYLLPFRGYPQRVYSEGINSNPLSTLLISAESVVGYSYDFNSNTVIKGSVQKALHYWICEFFKFSEGIEVKPLVEGYATEVLLKYGNKFVPINNTGFGISQILPVIYEIISNPNKILFVVDEPEIHLHPSAQTKLAQFFFEMSLVGKRILLETHSENLLNGLIGHLIKHEEKATRTCMYWVKKENTSSRVEKIVFDKLGYIVNQPESFMDEQTKISDGLAQIRIQKMSGSDEL